MANEKFQPIQTEYGPSILRQFYGPYKQGLLEGVVFTEEEKAHIFDEQQEMTPEKWEELRTRMNKAR